MPVMELIEELAFDATVRSMDKDGRMHISKTHISKATVNPYYGSEIPGYERLGLLATKIYYLFRDPIELARAASTFERLPILSKHVPVSAQSIPKELIIGAIGSDVEFNDPYLDADVCIWTNEAIAGIETDTAREWSCAYRYVPVMTPGDYRGQRYDGIMTEISGNHAILCETGRAGSDVLAADEDSMKTTKLGKALIVTLGGMSSKLAQDSLLALVGQATGKTFNAGEMSTKLIAMDADLDPKRLTATFDALIALDKKAKDEGEPGEETDSAPAQDAEHKEGCDCADCKTAKDAEEKEKEEKDKKAMDSAVAGIKRDLREADEARRAVRSVVGDVIAQDSASEIYTFALDHLKVDHKDVVGVPALRALFNLANTKSATPAPRLAQDSAGLVARFPNANRFRVA